MLIEKAVINASPFILLCKSDLCEILPELFAEIHMPEAVSNEIFQGNDTASQKLSDYRKNWLTVCQIKTVEDVIVWNLGDGETEVLSLAFENKAQFTALIDDRAARKCAETLNIKTLGTGGILILAKKRGLIENVANELIKLQSAGLWISNDVINAILKQANE